MIKISKLLNKYSFQTSLLISLVFLFIYTSMIPTFPVGLHYSDMFATLGSQGGLLQSPGYPLLGLFIWLISQSIGKIIGVAYSAHLLSAIFASSTLFILHQLLLELGNYAKLKHRNNFSNTSLIIQFLAIIPTLILGFSHMFWRHALFIERYMFTTLLITMVMYIVCRHFSRLNRPVAGSFFLGLVLSTGLLHQWIFLILLLPTGYLIYKDYQEKLITTKHLIALASGFITPILISFGILFVNSQRQIAYSNRIDSNFTAITEYFSSSYFGDGFAIDNNPNNILRQFEIEQLINATFKIFQETFNSLGWFLIPFLLLGLFYVPDRNRGLLPLYLVSSVALSLVSIAFIYNWTEDLNMYPEIIPAILFLQPFIVTLLWYGLYELTTRLLPAIRVLTKNNNISMGLLCSTILVTLFVGTIRYPAVSLKNKLYQYQISQGLLEDVDNPTSIVACFSYVSCYNLLYTQQIEKTGSQVKIVPFYYLPETVIFPYQELQKFDYQNFPFVMWDILTWNRQTHQIYTTDMFEGYFSLFSIDLGFFNYVPRGYYSQLTNGTPKSLPDTDLKLTDKILANNIARWDKALQKSKFNLVKRHMFNSSIYLKYGFRNRAVNEANIATTMGYDLPPQASEEIATLRSQVESILPSDFYELDTPLVSVDTIEEEMQPFLDVNNLPMAAKIAQGMLTVDPSDIDARLLYADLLERTQASSSAVIEYQNVLKLDPENETARERILYQNELGITGRLENS